AKPDKPKAPGATPSGGDQTCSDGDAIWGNEGDGAGCDPFDPNETLDPNFDEETAGGWIDADGAGFESLFDGLGDDLDFGDFGDEFDDSFFGEGFDDFGDAFGEDLGGDLKVAAGPRITTRSARLDKRRRAGLVVSCPKTAEKRCLGEVTLERPAKKAGKRPTLLGRALFSIPKGKKKTLRVRLPKAKAKKLTKARKGTPTDAVIEARDGGSSLWQSTARVRLRRR
uniref:hypothetical protein n=1 Tax=Paraconexibacter sp. TaxID=2949640 RepID=UPI003569C8A8